MMETGDSRTLSIQLVRVTLVGAAGVGKTRLIDSYMNAPPPDELEWSMPSTTQHELYHKVVVLNRNTGATDMAFDKDITVLVEIEDTPPSTLLELRDDVQVTTQVEATEGYLPENEAEKLDLRRLKHPMAKVLDMTRSTAIDIPEGVRHLSPFAIFDYPREIARQGTIYVKPLTQGHMGFALCFSLLDRQSLNEVVEISLLINLLKEKRQTIISPILFLIGTKDDLVGRPDMLGITKEVAQEAEEFAGRTGIPFFKVSAKSGRNVNRSLGEMIEQIVLTPSLCAFDIAKLDDEEDEGELEE